MADVTATTVTASERDAARAKLRDSINALTERTNVQLKMQQEPIKMLGGATGVGLALGVLVGRTLRRSRKIYVDAASSKKDQKAFAKVQTRGGGSGIGGALLATAVTIGFRVLQERVIAPRLGDFADQLLERGKQAEQPGGKAAANSAPVQKSVDLNKS